MSDSKKWTQDEDDFLKSNYGKWYTKAIAEELGRSEASIRKRAHMLGLSDSQDRFGDFTKEAISYLKTHYAGGSTKDIAEYLNKSESRTRALALQLGLKKKRSIEWSEEDIEFLKENLSLPYKDLEQKLDRTQLMISKKIKDLGLKKLSVRSWSKTQVEFLEENYKKIPLLEIRKEIHKGERNTKEKLIELGFEKKGPGVAWTDEEMTILKDCTNKYTTSQLTKMIKRTAGSIASKKKELGFVFNYMTIHQWKDTIVRLSKEGLYVNKIAKEIGYPLRVLNQYCLNENIHINHDPSIDNAYNKAISKGFNNPVDINDPKLIFCEWFVYWYDHYRKSQVVEKTKERYYAIYVTLHDEGLGKLKIRNITRGDVQKYVNWYGKDHAKVTVLGYLQIIRAAFKDAMYEGITTNNPAGNINLVFSEQKMSVKERKEKRDEKKWLEIEEYQKLRYFLLFNLGNTLKEEPDYSSGTYPNQVYYMLIFIALKTGARLGEVLGLTSEDVLPGTKELIIEKSWEYTNRGFKPTKNEASVRNTIVDEETISTLKQYVQWRDRYLETDENTLFILKNYRMHSSQLNKTLADILKGLAIPPITMHKLRHTQASYLLAKGIPEGLIAKRLGHSDTTMVRRVYGHLLKDAEESGNQRILELI